MTVGIGDKLGVHEITSLLGKGGMGEVYRARDSRLKRDVAIKILPAEFSSDPDRLLRFRREAEVLASLNHPNIGAIYDFQEAGDTQFLVMELVEGQTLADRLQRGPLSIEDALPIATQICDALDAAHEKGIIHRDLKPANISIANDGRVKVLDFGLAKAMEPARVGGAMANSPTLSLTATQAGVILGTAAYMSPEQAKGFEADRRSDIFSFGCVLYELLTGRQPFQGETVPDVLASVLVREPDLSALSPALSPRLVELLQRCLQKNPKRRWHSAGDVREELEIISRNPHSAALPGAAAAPLSLWKRAVPVVVTGTMCAALAAAAAWMLKPSPATPLARFALALPEGQNFSRTRSHVSAVSPDGSMVVYAANQQLYLRRISELDAQPIAGSNEDVGSPFFSPDGRWIGFFSFSDNAIKKIPVGGGTAIPVCSACTNTLGYGVSWNGGTIVFSRNGLEILKVPDTGGKPAVWVKAGPNELLSSPQILPDGKRLMFSVANSSMDWSKANIVILTESGERTVAIRGGSGARYLATGHIAYSVGGDVYAIPFDVDRVVTTGDPVQVVKGLLRSPIDYGARNFDVSMTGTLVYASGNAFEADSVAVAIADRAGNIRLVPGLRPGSYRTPRVSPDGSQVAMEVIDDASISIYDLSSKSQLRRLTLEGTNQMPVWSPDGTRIAFRSVRGGQAALFVQNANGSGPAEQLLTFEGGAWPMAWSDDGRIVFVRDRRLWTFSLKDRRAEPMPDADGPDDSRGQVNLSLSRGSEWAAFVSSGGRPSGNRVFLRQFPGGTKYLVSRELANAPVWARDGLELFYFQTESRRLVSVRVTPPPAFSLSEPAVIPLKSFIQAEGDLRQFDVMPDGTFLTLQPVSEGGRIGSSQTQQVHVVLNWLDELPRIAPPSR